MDYAQLKKDFAQHNERIDVEPLVQAYVIAEDGWTYLETLTTKELLAIKAQLFKDGIESEFANAQSSQGKLVFVVNKALVTALS